MLLLTQVHPLDAERVGVVLQAHPECLVVEDHFGHSGLYASVCQLVMEQRLHCVVQSAAPPPSYDLVVGSSPASYHRRYGLDARGLSERLARTNGHNGKRGLQVEHSAR